MKKGLCSIGVWVKDQEMDYFLNALFFIQICWFKAVWSSVVVQHTHLQWQRIQAKMKTWKKTKYKAAPQAFYKSIFRALTGSCNILTGY